MKDMVRSLAYGLTGKRVREKELAPIRLCPKEQEVSFFNLSTNPILTVEQEGTLYYFRECPPLASRKAFFAEAAEDVFSSLGRLGISRDHFKQAVPIPLSFSAAEVSSFRSFLRGKMAKPSFFRTMEQADRLAADGGFSIWEKQTYDAVFFSRFGLEGLPEGTENLAVYFLWCMRSAADRYRTLRVACGENHSFFGAVRGIASRIVAEELGLSHMIPKARWCVLQEGGKSRLGLLSDAAPGSRMMDSVLEPNGSLQRELLNLNALDFICCQTDHGPNNYSVARRGERYSLCAFDNDNPYTFFPDGAGRRALAGCAPLIDRTGMVCRPFFDRELAERIAALEIGNLKERVRPYLNPLQIRALEQRIRKLDGAVQKTQAVRENFLLLPDQWNEQTLAEEVTGDYGITYLTRAIQLEDRPL